MEPAVVDRPAPEADTRTQVVVWRLEQLRRAGFGEETARELAGRLDVDLHGAIALVRRGCPPATAARIVR